LIIGFTNDFEGAALVKIVYFNIAGFKKFIAFWFIRAPEFRGTGGISGCGGDGGFCSTCEK
jgi:hypothetical protein